MGNLERAIEIAASAHRGQTDKGGQPYILHPIRVMLRMNTAEERIAAVLHDVVEDSEWTFDALTEEGFSPAVVEALRALTKPVVAKFSKNYFRHCGTSYGVSHLYFDSVS